MPPRVRTDQQDPAETGAAEEPQTAMITLAVGHPYDELVLHDVEDDKGKPLVITAAGTDVPAADEDTIRTAAKDAGVPIRKVR